MQMHLKMLLLQKPVRSLVPAVRVDNDMKIFNP